MGKLLPSFIERSREYGSPCMFNNCCLIQLMMRRNLAEFRDCSQRDSKTCEAYYKLKEEK